MNKKTYHFKYLRLSVSPQTRVNSDINTPGFMSLDECKTFCSKIGFSYSIYYYDIEGKATKVYEG